MKTSKPPPRSTTTATDATDPSRRALGGRAGSFDVTLESERVAAILPAVGTVKPHLLALPSLVNLHAHANRAFAASAQRPQPLDAAGDGDMLETAFVGAMASHVDDPEALTALVCGGRRRIEVGDVADLVLVPASSFDDALARRPGGRVVLRRGRQVSAAPFDATSSYQAVLVDAAQ